MIISIGKPKVKSNFFIPLINIFFLFMRLIDRFDCLLHVAPPFPLTFPRLVFRKMRPLPSICTLQIRHLCTKLSTRFYGKAYLLYICFINYIYICVCVYMYISAMGRRVALFIYYYTQGIVLIQMPHLFLVAFISLSFFLILHAVFKFLFLK